MHHVDFTTPDSFFQTAVSEAACNLNVDLDDNIEFYLVNLLCDFVQPQTMTIGQLDVLDTPLAIIYKQAIESTPSMQLKLYKKLGDVSLYIAGYFSPSLNRKSVNSDYYISMGSSAYGRLSDIMKSRHREEHFTEMYLSLSKEFRTLVEITTKVSELLSKKF